MKTVLTILVVFSFVLNFCSGASEPHEYILEYFDPLVDAWPQLGYNVRSVRQLKEEDTTVEQQTRGNTGGACNGTGSGPNICGGNGQCTNGICYCVSGYTGTNCSYHQKQQLVAFLLEFFVGSYTGAGSFYLGYTGQGVGKILLTWGSCAIICVLSIFGAIAFCGATACCALCGGEDAAALCGGCLGGVMVTLGSILALAAFIAAWIWSLVDWALIAADELNDANGYPLESW